MTESSLLHIDRIRKVYGGEVALADASMGVDQGTIHGLLGANGAGKSTLVRIVCGVEPQDGGTVSIGGGQLPVPHSAGDAAAAGIAYIHQDRALVPDLSIAENLALVLGYPVRGHLVSMRGMRRAAEAALSRVELGHDVDTPVRELPIADQTMVAIGRALATDARLILLDEPTANLGAAESEWLYGRLRALAANGVACLLITHALGEALDVCDTITVLRDGRVVATASAASLTETAVTDLMMGERVGGAGNGTADRAPRPSAGTPRLVLDEVRYERLGPLSLAIEPGEVVAVTGLADSGHLLVGEVLIGAASIDGGEMLLDGERFEPGDVAAARATGVAYVPSDRANEGLALEMTARENLYLAGSQFSLPVRGINLRRERRAARQALIDGRVKPADPESLLTTLSGGNMQKVLLAKELAGEPLLLVLAEPTVGVDVRARRDIYERLRVACAAGLGVVLASSDFEEVAALSDKVVVLRYGRVVRTLVGNEISIDRLHALSSGSRLEAAA